MHEMLLHQMLVGSATPPHTYESACTRTHTSMHARAHGQECLRMHVLTRRIRLYTQILAEEELGDSAVSVVQPFLTFLMCLTEAEDDGR